MALLTATEALSWIPGLTNPDAETITAIEAAIARADSILATELGYSAPVEGQSETLELSQYTRFRQGPGGRELQLPFWPVVVDDDHELSIEDDPNEDFDGTTYLVDSADYELRPGGIVLLGASSSHGTWTDTDDYVIKATWWAGYVAADLPGRLKEGLGVMTGILWGRKSSIGKDLVNTGRQTVTPRKPRTVPDEVLDLIAPYRIIGGLL